MDYVIELGRRERKRQAVHQTVLEAARLLFIERGVSRTTVEDIAEAADVARQTVFNHFPYKEALAIELAAEGIQRIAEQAQAMLESGASALEVLLRTGQSVLDLALSQGEQAAVVARELLHADVDRAQRAADRVPLSPLFEAILLQAREEGSVRGDLPLDVIAYRIGAVVASIVAQVQNRDAEGLRRDLNVCFEVFFHGITERSN